jgi:tol-pal system protein YbgF
MHFRTILSGTLAAILLSAPAVQARDAAPTSPRAGAHGVPTPRIGLPGVFSSGDEKPIQLAQAETDPRVVALEEQIRSLNGTMEELNFQILQLQEQIRKMQEDNEFRFQELEKKSDARSPKANGTVAEKPLKQGEAEKPLKQGEAEAPVKQAEQAAPASVEDIIVNDEPMDNSGQAAAPGEAPKNFGVLKVDKDGNVVTEGATALPGVAAANPPAPPAAAADDTVVAALPASNDPEELYRNAYQFILSGDYGTAESGFRDHIARFPQDGRAADAHFWLGESLLGQKKYRDAAEVFLAANKDYPKSKKAPDMLLKLGISLVGLNQKDVACATFGEVGKRYPEASAALKDRVKQDKALAGC